MTHNTYLRRIRSRWMLSQGDIADLLGLHQGRISRFENGEEYPSLLVALGVQVIFGRAPRSCFAAAYAEIEEQVITHAAELERTLADKRDFASVKKRQLLRAMMERATSAPTP